MEGERQPERPDESGRSSVLPIAIGIRYSPLEKSKKLKAEGLKQEIEIIRKHF